jgi:putative peptidoglycan lipid II flippase
VNGPPAGAGGGRGSLMVAAGIGLSRVAGLVREVVIAAFLGSGIAANAFTAAFRIPNLLQNLLGEGVLSASFIPVYSRLLAEGRHREASRVAGTVVSLLLLVTGVLVLLGVLAAGPITSLIAPGSTGDQRELTVALVAIVTPGIGVLVISAWCLGVLNSHRSFFLPYVAPVLWNAAQVVALVALGLTVFRGALDGDPTAALTPDARGLALTLGWATVAGALLQLAVQVPAVRRLEPGLRPSLRLDPATRGVLRRFGPAVGGRGVVQISALVDLAVATYLVGGGLATLRYGQVLYLLPISLFGMSIAASELPELSGRTAGADRRAAAAAVRRRLRAGLARIAFFVVPTAVAFVVVGDLVVGALLQRGAFTRSDTLQVWAVIAAYGLGLVAATASRLLQSALYGLGDTRTPALASTARVVLSLAVGVLLMLQLDRVGLVDGGLAVVGQLPAVTAVEQAVRTDPTTAPRFGAAGLALGAAAAAWLELHLLRRTLRRRVGDVDPTGGALDVTLLAALAATATAVLGRWLLAGTPPLVQGVLALGAAGATYLLATRLLGFPAVAALAGRPPRGRSATAGPSTSRPRRGP